MLMLMTRQVPALSVVGVLAQTQESFCHTRFITEQIPLGWRTYLLLSVNLQASVLTNNEDSLTGNVTGLRRFTDYVKWGLVQLSDMAGASHLQVGWPRLKELTGPSRGFWKQKMWSGKGKYSLSLVPPCLLQNKICWIWVWRRLTRELGGCPWGLCVCFPKTASDTHYEQLTTLLPSVSCLLSLFLCQENIWGHRIKGFNPYCTLSGSHTGWVCFALLLAFLPVWWGILAWSGSSVLPRIFFLFSSSFGFLVAASLFL